MTRIHTLYLLIESIAGRDGAEAEALPRQAEVRIYCDLWHHRNDFLPLLTLVG